MIPVWPIVWIVVLGVRYLMRDRNAPPQPASPPSGASLLEGLWLIPCLLGCAAAVAMYALTVALVLAGAIHVLPVGHVVPQFLLAVLAIAGIVGIIPVFFTSPLWISWRIARPLGLFRLAEAFFRFSPYTGRLEQEGYVRLVATAQGKPVAAGERVAASPWSTCAAALHAERLHDAAHADRLVRSLADLPPRTGISKAARVYGIEALCWAAAERRDWDAVGKRAELGSGRGVRLLRLVAAAHTSGRASAAALWSACLIAPARRRSYGLVQAALRDERPATAAPGGHPLPRRGGIFGLHLALLAEGAEGGAIPAPELGRLLAGWEAKLGALDEARLRARGLELGARDAAAALASIRRSILEQLEALAASADGPPPRLPGRAIAGELAQRSRDRLFRALDPYLERSRGDFPDLASPLQEWEQWLRFREAVEAIETRFGSEGLRTAWHAGLRTAAWNWPCKVLNTHGQPGAWASHVMFSWVAAVAGKVGDAEAAATNLKNAETAGATAQLP